MDIATRETVLRLLLEALIAADSGYLRIHPGTPWLYTSGVRYQEDDEAFESWLDIPETLARGVGDCKDVAAWRIAELRVRLRESALPRVTFARVGNRVKFHVVVIRADGRIEDPSRELGLR